MYRRGTSIPAFGRDEFDAYVRCGRLEHVVYLSTPPVFRVILGNPYLITFTMFDLLLAAARSISAFEN